MLQSLKNIYKNRGFQRASDTWNLVGGNHLRSRKNGFASGSKFRKGDSTALDEFIIYGVLSNPFFLKTVNNFNASQPFGLYDIFNYLICSPELIAGSTLRFKRALAYAYYSVDLPVWRSSVRRVLAKANFLESLFVCFSFARCLPFYDRVATPRHGISFYPKDKTMI